MCLTHVKNFDGPMTMSLLDEDGKLLKKYNEIWSKIQEIMERKKFNSDRNSLRNIWKPIWNLTITKSPQNTITKSSNGKATKEGMKCICLSAMVINLAFKWQTFLEKFK